MRLLSRSRKQKSARVQVCAPLGHNLILIALLQINDISHNAETNVQRLLYSISLQYN